MSEEVLRLIKKAEHALEVAEAMQKDSYLSDAASQVYYAMFYAAQALLKSEGIQATKHSAVESFLGRHFVKTGRIDPKYHKMLISARKTREIADYDIKEEIIESVASSKLAEGKAFINIIKEMLEA